MRALEGLHLSGAEVLPLIEGGKGISITDGGSAGAWAGAGGVGTFSAVNADCYDAQGNLIPQIYKGRTRRERHGELIDFAVRGALYQAKVAHETASGRGRIHANILWEMGGAETVLKRMLEKAKGLIHGVTCGAGMPYRLAQICASFNVDYYPIVSSARAFRALWKRAYHKFVERLGAVVYEDPWRAGGHNGLSNSEHPHQPENPRPRVRALRAMMNQFGLQRVPIIMAGGVWCLREWEDWIDDPEIAPIAFQFGTRPLLTQESPIPEVWKKRLLTLKKGDVLLQRFSPTGFYSSALRNDFIKELEAIAARQVPYRTHSEEDFVHRYGVGPRKRPVYVREKDQALITSWMAQGWSEALRTPDGTLVFVDEKKAATIHRDQVECMGCLSACRFSNWAQGSEGNTGHRPDPRSFCIQKTLQRAAHDPDNLENELVFAGHNAFRFAQDPFYSNGFVPTVKQLMERIVTGD